jgi:hypothetical protein
MRHPTIGRSEKAPVMRLKIHSLLFLICFCFILPITAPAAAIGLGDAVNVLKATAGISAPLAVADVNGDGKVGLPEAIYLLQVIAGLRSGNDYGIGVPDVVLASQPAAEETITTAILVVGAVTQEVSATVPAGVVLGQEPAAGERVLAGTAVSLTVSIGPSFETISGRVVKGPVSGAEVRAYSMSSGGVLGSFLSGPFRTTTDGAWTGRIPTRVGESLVALLSAGGTYSDEASGTLQTLDPADPISGVLLPGQLEIGLTPYSQLALQLGRRYAPATGFAVALRQAATQLEAAFLFDPLQTLPPSPLTVPEGATEQEKLYAVALGGISTLLHANPMLSGAGLADTSKSRLIQSLLADMADGKLDGLDSTGALIQVDTAAGKVNFPALSPGDLSALRNTTDAFRSTQADAGQTSLKYVQVPTAISLLPQVPGNPCAKITTAAALKGLLDVAAGAKAPQNGGTTMGEDRALRIAQELMSQAKGMGVCGQRTTASTQTAIQTALRQMADGQIDAAKATIAARINEIVTGGSLASRMVMLVQPPGAITDLLDLAAFQEQLGVDSSSTRAEINAQFTAWAGDQMTTTDYRALLDIAAVAEQLGLTSIRNQAFGEVVAHFTDDLTALMQQFDACTAEQWNVDLMTTTLANARMLGINYLAIDSGITDKLAMAEQRLNGTVFSQCAPLGLLVDFPQFILTGTTAPLSVLAGDESPSGGIIGLANLPITLTVTGGTANPPSGVTDSLGGFDAVVTPNDGATDVSVSAAVTDPVYSRTAEWTVYMQVKNDVMPPVFDGAASAAPLGCRGARLAWNRATDAVSPPESIVYRIFAATTSGGQDFPWGYQQTDPGSTFYDYRNLPPDTTSYFVVRACDLDDNCDTNTVEVSARTPAAVGSCDSHIDYRLKAPLSNIDPLNSSYDLENTTFLSIWGGAVDPESTLGCTYSEQSVGLGADQHVPVSLSISSGQCSGLAQIDIVYGPVSQHDFEGTGILLNATWAVPQAGNGSVRFRVGGYVTLPGPGTLYVLPNYRWPLQFVRLSSMENPRIFMQAGSDIPGFRWVDFSCDYWNYFNGSCIGTRTSIPQAGTWPLHMQIQGGVNNVPWNVNASGTAIEMFFVPE